MLRGRRPSARLAWPARGCAPEWGSPSDASLTPTSRRDLLAARRAQRASAAAPDPPRWVARDRRGAGGGRRGSRGRHARPRDRRPPGDGRVEDPAPAGDEGRRHASRGGRQAIDANPCPQSPRRPARLARLGRPGARRWRRVCSSRSPARTIAPPRQLLLGRRDSQRRRSRDRLRRKRPRDHAPGDRPGRREAHQGQRLRRRDLAADPRARQRLRRPGSRADMVGDL